MIGGHFFRNKKINIVKKYRKEIGGLKKNLNETTAYLDDFLAFLPLPICDVNSFGVINNVNKSFEELTGFKFSEVIGKHISGFLIEKEKIDDYFRMVEKEDIVKNKEMSLITKEKKKTPVSVSFSAKKDSRGKLMGCLISITDITILKDFQAKTEEKIGERTKDLENSRTALLNMLEDTEATKQQIEREKNRSQVIFNNFLDGLLIFNSKEGLELLNPRAEEFLKVRQQDLLGKTTKQLIEIPQIRELAEKLYKRKKDIFREELPFKEGEAVVEVTTQKLNPQDKDSSTLVILHDISRE
ncbi:MAG: PAS domain-containing protein, partial [Candidatus Parcubacteria bacterium]|nr:PAS domain-containing protein [Candidatus Parcubacteria bacterium]